MDPAGNLFITDAGLSLVHEVSAATGIMRFCRKNRCTQLGDGGPRQKRKSNTQSELQPIQPGMSSSWTATPTGFAVTVATGIITTVAVREFLATAAWNPRHRVQLAQPNDVTTDAVGNIYFQTLHTAAFAGSMQLQASFPRSQVSEAPVSVATGAAIDAQMEYPKDFGSMPPTTCISPTASTIEFALWHAAGHEPDLNDHQAFRFSRNVERRPDADIDRRRNGGKRLRTGGRLTFYDGQPRWEAAH